MRYLQVFSDGHNRYEICERFRIPFKTVQKDFADRDEAIRWIILNQFGRRNLPAHERARLALRLKPILAEQKEKNLHLSGGAGVKGSQKSDNLSDTKHDLAAIAGVSHDTIASLSLRKIFLKRRLRRRRRRGRQNTMAISTVDLGKYFPKSKRVAPVTNWERLPVSQVRHTNTNERLLVRNLTSHLSSLSS